MRSRILCICSIPIIFALWIVEKTKTSLNKDWFKMAGAEGLEAEWGFNQMLFNHPHCYIVLYSVF